MDGLRFDDLTRALTLTGSRRRLITSLTGVAFGVVGLRRVDARGCSTAGTICREHANCCSGTCGPKDRYGRRKCTCGSADDCPTPNRPCQVATCEAGVCEVTTAEDETTCAGGDGVCVNGACITCTEIEGECNQNEDCCSGICQNETCVATVAGTCTSGSGTCGNEECGCVEVSGILTCADSGFCGDSINSQADCEEGTYFVSPSPFCNGGNGCLSPPCQPSYDGCFTRATRIAMADGTSKPIELIVIGDEVLGRNGINRVVEIKRPQLRNRHLYALNDGPFFVTAAHPFLTEDGWKAVDPSASVAEHHSLVVDRLTIGDRLLALVGAKVPVVVGDGRVCEEESRADLAPVTLGSLTGVVADPATPLYNLRLDGDHTYFANELLVHNK